MGLNAIGAATIAGMVGYEQGVALSAVNRVSRGTTLPPVLADPPYPLTSMIGREREMAAVIASLRRPEVRLLTLTGPGGVGKTRLALATAQALREEFDGFVAYVSLAALIDPGLVEHAIIEGMGLGGMAGTTLAERLRRAFGGRALLLVLDNAEQVASAAPKIAALVASSPGLKALVTSRERLRVAGEREYVVAPLDVPAALPASMVPDEEHAQAALAAPAVALFLDRVRAVRPGMTLLPGETATIVDICRRLDGLPLALELAAARSKLLTMPALLLRLERRLPLLTGGPRDQPARQQTLRDTIAWSYDLLSSEEQALFRRLTVFVGGFTLDAAEIVAGHGDAARATDAPDSFAMPVLDGIFSLVDKSLLRQADGADSDGEGSLRFTFLETVREFGQELVHRRGEAESIRERHARWCLELVEGAWTAPSADPIPAEVAARIEAELPNMREAIDWFVASGDAALALALTGILAPLWLSRSYRAEGRAQLDRVLTMPGADAAPAAVRARAVHGAAALARTQNDRAGAAALCEQGLAIYRELDDPVGMAAALHLLGVIARSEGELDRATALCSESLALFEQIGDLSWLALVHCDLGGLAFWRGDLAAAEGLLEEALRGYRQRGNRWGVAFTLHVLGSVVTDAGDAVRAAKLLSESLSLARDIGARESQIDAISAIAVLAARSGHPEDAARLLAAADAAADRLDYGVESPEAARYAAAAAAARAFMGDPAFTAAHAAGHTLALDATTEDALATASRVASGASSASPTRSTRASHATSNTPPVTGVLADLTAREREVLQLLADGRSDKDIGDALFISHRTAMRHVANILTKLGVNSRTAAAALAHREGRR